MSIFSQNTENTNVPPIVEKIDPLLVKTSVQASGDATVVKKQQHHEDPRLKYYEQWMKQRKRIFHKMGRQLKRQPGDLLTSVCENVRKVNEEKLWLEFCKDAMYFDKWRGNPEWWSLPPGVAGLRPEYFGPTHFWMKTRQERNEPPPLEQIGMADYVLREKMLIPRVRDLHKMWYSSEYRAKRMKELEYCLKNIKPHKPNFHELIVLGKPIKSDYFDMSQNNLNPKNAKDLKVVPEIGVNDNEVIKIDQCEDMDAISPTVEPKLALNINGVSLCLGASAKIVSRKFYVIMEYDIFKKSVSTEYIVFENVGTRTIRIYWNEYIVPPLFSDYPRMPNQEQFCFDKNELIILPGQTLDFPIWFKAEQPCTVIENWEISTLPIIWQPPVRVLVVLQAYAYMGKFKEKITTLSKNIETKIKTRVIKEVMDELLVKLKYSSIPPISHSFYEKQLFEAANIDENDIERKPKYIYDEYTVKQLKEFYQTVRQEHHPANWNLSIDDLIKITRERDLLIYIEEKASQNINQRSKLSQKLSEISELKNSGKEKSKTPRSDTMRTPKSNKALKTDTSTKSFVYKFNESDFIIKETEYSKLTKLVSSLERPVLLCNENRSKYFLAYSIMCSYISQMCRQLEGFTSPEVLMTPINIKPTSKLPERLIYEYYDDFCPSRPKLLSGDESTQFKSRPKPERLRNIQDVKLIHQAYFGTGPPASANKDKKAVKSPKKDLKTDASKGSSKIQIIDLSDKPSAFVFDPYAEEFVPPTFSEQNISQNKSLESHETLAKNDNENRQYNIYVIVYYYLGEAIDAIVDMLESYKETFLSHADLERLQTCYGLSSELAAEQPEGALVVSVEKPQSPYRTVSELSSFTKLFEQYNNEDVRKYVLDGQVKMTPERAPQNLNQDSLWSHIREANFSVEEIKEVFPSVTETAKIEEIGDLLRDVTTQTSQEYIAPSEMPKIVSAETVSVEQKNYEDYYYSDDEVFILPTAKESKK